MIIVLIGPPGCGKGTQGQRLTNKLKNFKYINAGDLFRELVKANPDHEAAKILKEGKLLSDALVNSTIALYLSKGGQYILDGFPRSIAQAEHLAKNYTNKIIAFLFEISENDLLSRITGRYSCKNCGHLYNKHSMQPNIEGVCNTCQNTSFYVREDDNEDILKIRLQEYEKRTYDLLEYFKNKNQALVIDASLPADIIEKKLYNELLQLM
jgi:adenylate kinase